MYSVSNTHYDNAGTGLIRISGSNNQLIESTAVITRGELPNVEIDKSGGTATFDGIISIRGNLEYVKGNVDATTNLSTVSLEGNNLLLDGESVTGHLRFYDLVLSGNNHARRLTGNVIVANTLSLGNSDMHLESHELIIERSNPDAITRITGHISSETSDNKSKINWNIGTDVGLYTFPFGNNNDDYIPLQFQVTDGGDVGTVSISTYQTASDNTPFPVTPDAVTNMDNRSGIDNTSNAIDRFWQVDKDGVDGTATLTFGYAQAEVQDNVIGKENQLLAHRYDKTTDKWVQPTLPGQVTDAAANSVTVSGITEFSPWALFFEANNSPVVQNDTYSVDEDNILIVSAATGVLQNDSDIDGVGVFDGLTIGGLISGPSNGTLLGSWVDGSFNYEPNANYNGQDTIVFNVCDGGIPQLCALDTVFITINPVNDYPLNSATNLFFSSNAKNQIITVQTLNFIKDSQDPLGNMDPATVKITEAPTNGIISIDPLTGIITYTPNPGFLGFDSFRYEACDDGNPLPSLCQQGFIGMTFIEDTDGDLLPDAWEIDANNDGIVDRDFITCSNMFTDDVDFVPAAINGNLNATMTHDAGYYNATITSTNPTTGAYNAGYPRYVDNASNVSISRSGGSGASTTIVFDKPSFNQQITIASIGSNESQRVEFFYQGKKILLVPSLGSSGAFINDTISLTSGFSASFSFTTFLPIDSMIITSVGTADDIFINIDGDACMVLDSDGDGIFDHLDLDLDGDGLYNIVENGALNQSGVKDDNHDGMIDGVPSDFGGNGLFNGIESDDGFKPTVTFAYTNSDVDGILNYLDLDSDGDGIPDNVEGQVTVGYIEPSGNDTDSNGVDDAYDTNGNWIDPVNTDNAADGADYIDTDSDDDGMRDTTEAAIVLDNSDGDNDGLDDITDTTIGYSDPNGTIDTPSLLPDVDGNINSGGDVDYREILDSDNDGIANNLDLDDDNDGILDYEEGCGELIINGSFEKDDFTDTNIYSGPFAGVNGTFIGATYNSDSLSGWNYTQNLDGWVEGGNWADAYHGIQYIDIIGNNNVTGGVSNELTQVINTIPGNNYVFSFYWGEDVGHGIPEVINFEASIIDSNNAIILNESLGKNAVGPNGAGIRGPNNWFYYNKIFVATTTKTTIKFTATPPGGGDTSAGASLDLVSVVPATHADCRDTDNDNIPDAFDLDSDGDGIYDIVEAGNVNLDGDHDGIIDGLSVDFGANGLYHSIESDDGHFATINYTITNSDVDGILNYLDLDSDGDGIPDNIEGQPTVGYIAPSGNDTDNNGVDDAYDTNGTWIDPVNTDNAADGSDYIDTDSDDDGINDNIEAPIPIIGIDVDADGLDDIIDADKTGYKDPNGKIDDPTLMRDIDGDVLTGGDVDFRDASDDRPDNDEDGTVDIIDLDDDNDGILDITECHTPTFNSGFGLSLGSDDLNWNVEWIDGPAGKQYAPVGIPGIIPATIIGNLGLGGWAGAPAGSISDWISHPFNDIIGGPGNHIDADMDGIIFERPNLGPPAGPTGDWVRLNFSTTISLPVGTAATFFLNFDMAADDGTFGGDANGFTLPVEIYVNGTLQTTPLFSYDILTNVNLASDWQDGNNLIEIRVCSGPNVGGLLVTNTTSALDDCDKDNDGIANHLDLDSDNDGIYDIVESGVLNETGVTDDDNDGMIDGNPIDFGNNGLFNGIENNDTPAGTITYTPNDTDSDSILDAQELDADADGCNDVIEAGFDDVDLMDC